MLRTNKPLGRLNHDAIYSVTGLRRSEQDGSRCQHEFASLVCLSGASAEKTPQSHCVGCTGRGRLASVIRRCGRLTRLSVVSNETLFFPVPCFPTSRLLLVFFLNRKWDTSNKNWQKYGRHRWKIVGFTIWSFVSRIRRREAFICKIIFLSVMLCFTLIAYLQGKNTMEMLP